VTEIKETMTVDEILEVKPEISVAEVIAIKNDMSVEEMVAMKNEVGGGEGQLRNDWCHSFRPYQCLRV
jgi:hypothetical protein